MKRDASRRVRSRLHRSQRRMLGETLEQRQLLAADVNPWHNAASPTDVNRDGFVSGIDALLIINDINGGSSDLRTRSARDVSAAVDVNNDSFVSGIDALLVINRINADANPNPDAAGLPTNDQYTLPEDSVLTVDAENGVLANDRDADEIITAVLATGPTNGVLDLAADGSFVYTPVANYAGSDSFEYRVVEADVESDLVTVSLTVTPVNDAPVAVNDLYQAEVDGVIDVDASAGILANDSDVDNTELTIQRVGNGPFNGALTLQEDGSFVYTPNAGFDGRDSFRYILTDGNATSLSAQVVLAIGNDVPVARSDNYELDLNTTLDVEFANRVLVNDTDADGDALGVTLVEDVQHGTLDLRADGTFSYTPDDNFVGTDSFQYAASDGIATSDPAVVTFTVNAIDDSPRASADHYEVNEDEVLDVPAVDGVLANDVNPAGNGGLMATLITEPEFGVILFNADGSFVYTPSENYNGSDSFTYVASSVALSSAETTVTLTVHAVNDAPIAHMDAYVAQAGTPLVVPAEDGLGRNDTDVDGDLLTPVVRTDPMHGQIAVNPGGSFTYTPDDEFSGIDTFTYVTNDGEADSNEVTVWVSVRGVDALVEVTLTPVSANGAPISTIPVGGSFFIDVTVEDLQEVPSGVFQAFIDVLYDSTLVTVTGDPVFGDDYPNSHRFDRTTPGLVDEAGAIGGLSELGGGAKLLMRIPVRGVQGGIAVFAADDAELSPQNDVLLYGGFDAVPDAQIVYVPGSVALIEGVTPIAVDDDYSVNEDGELTIGVDSSILANDSHPEELPLTAELVATTANGSLTLNEDGTFDYVPDADFHGLDTFTYVASDGTVNSNLATVSITVNPIDDLPVALDDEYDVTGSAINVSAANGVLANDTDIDGEVLFAVLETGPLHGTLELSDDGSFIYTPNAAFIGQDSFTYRAEAGLGQSNVATVTLNVDDLTPSSLAGFVYTDVNNDGIRAPHEAPITGITITLRGVTDAGDTVFRTTTTGRDGSYRFDGVTRGSYTVSEEQPLFMIDGKDTFSGTVSETNDEIAIDLPPGTNATGINFGEWGLLPDFAGSWNLWSNQPTGELISAIDADGNQDWFCSMAGWEEYRTVTVALNASRTVATITAVNGQGQTFTSSIATIGNPLFQIIGERPGEGFIVRLAGPASEFGLVSAAGVDAVFAQGA